MTDQEKIEWLAVNLFGWKFVKNDDGKICGVVEPDSYLHEANRLDPPNYLQDWNHTMDVFKAMMSKEGTADDLITLRHALCQANQEAICKAAFLALQ